MPYTEEELRQWYPTACPKCGWRGLSRDCAGGDPIADTGDFDDPLCPQCLTVVYEVELDIITDLEN